MGALEYAADAPRYPGGRADAMPYAPLTPNEKAQGPKHEGSSLAPRPSVLPAPAASRAPAAAEHAAPSGPDREAARKLEANLRELIVEASKQAGGEAVFVELDGRMQRGKLISADANGIAVQVGANRLPLPWAFVTPRSLYGLARPFVKDAGLLGRYCRAMGLDREAEALELAFAEGRR
ncbi:MAG: hypothetical protein M5U26_16280 [Planctomycetota bacterium]|nr:hypothetical protein [Planctomycetota bacterium]